MHTHSTLDRESFQNLLARASLAQEYLDGQKAKCPAVDVPPEPAIGEQPKEPILVDYIQSLSALVAVQRLIATDDVDVDGAMALIADQARNVANASGVAIGLLEGDNLVYRAGSGGAATYIGRHVKATLSVSRASGEILRVENTQTDARIEAAICRQFGAKALLIVPICRGRTVVGAIEILFYDAHAFQDREVRTYQLMAGLVTEAISRAAELELKQALAAEERKEHAHSAAAHGAIEAEGREWSLFRLSAGVATMSAQVRSVFSCISLSGNRQQWLWCWSWPAGLPTLIAAPFLPCQFQSYRDRMRLSSRYPSHPRSRRRTARPSRRPRQLQRKRRRKLPGPRRRGLGSGATSITSLKM